MYRNDFAGFWLARTTGDNQLVVRIPKTDDDCVAGRLFSRIILLSFFVPTLLSFYFFSLFIFSNSRTE